MAALALKGGVRRTLVLVGWTAALLLLLSPLWFRTFAFQTFNIPAGSMMPTLLIGDYIAVSKYSYGYSRFSLPLSPALWSGRIFAAEPRPGDLVVFRLPKAPTTDYVKRVVGLPGDRIQMVKGVLHLNGQPVRRDRLDDYVDSSDGRQVRIKRWREVLPNGVSYETLDLQDNGFLDDTQVYIVPPGHYFMLGDHRDNSTDSRVLSQVGYIPAENLVGRVEMVLMSIDRENKNGGVRDDRIALRVH